MSIEKNNVYCVDCLEGMKQLPDNFVDLTITSPPYNAGNNVRGNFYEEYKDNLTNDEYYNWIKKVMQETIRITKYYTFFNFQLLKDNKETYFKLIGDFSENIKEVVIWTKQGASPIVPTQMANNYEIILVLTKKEYAISKAFERCNFNNRKKGQYNPNLIQGLSTAHKENLTDSGTNKAIFPLYFVNWFLDKFAQKGDLIFDPFNGSGTTTLCAKLKGLDYLGFEIEQAQVEHCKKRLMQENLFSNKLELEKND